MSKTNVDTLFGHGALRSKHKPVLNVDSFERGALMSKLKLELNIDTFEQGSLMSKLKLELNVNTFECGGINVIAAPGRVREGDRSGQVRLV